MLKPHGTVNQVRVENSMYVKYLTPKHNVQTVNDTKTTMKHIDNYESLYLRSGYVSGVDITVLPKDKFIHLAQTVMVNR